MTNVNARGLVLVTGGSGYVASFCMAQLLNEGWRVRATVRSLGREKEVRAALSALTDAPGRLEFAVADLESDDGWLDAALGCTYVLHIASPLSSSAADGDDALVRPARDGTLRVLRAARDAGVQRVVMTSSTAAVAYGHGSVDIPWTEAAWTKAGDRSDTSAYERSKLAAERAAWDWVAAHGEGLELTTVCPGAVLGPVLGREFSASIDIVKKLLDGSLPGLPRFGWPLVDVRDIADLHVRAMMSDRAAGQRYIGAGPFIWMADIAQTLRNAGPGLGRRPPRLRLPDWLIRIAANFDPVLKGRLFELGKRRPVSAQKAKDELGWSARPYDATIVATARSLVEWGIIKTG